MTTESLTPDVKRRFIMRRIPRTIYLNVLIAKWNLNVLAKFTVNTTNTDQTWLSEKNWYVNECYWTAQNSTTLSNCVIVRFCWHAWIVAGATYSAKFSFILTLMEDPLFPINWLMPVNLTWLLLMNTILRTPVFSVNVLHAWRQKTYVRNESFALCV